MGYSPTGINGFGRAVVYGFSRVPLPPARMTTGVCSQSMDIGDGLFIDLIPFNCLFYGLAERISRRPAQMQRRFAGIGDQAMDLAGHGPHAIRALANEQLHSENRGHSFDDFADAVLFAGSKVEYFSGDVA